MISVIIPTRNGERFLPDLLHLLQRQTIAAELEIMVVDSSSTDATPEIARRFGTRLITIAAAEFDHGGTRTMAAEQSENEIIVFLTQDAEPVNEECLSRLVGPLRKNGKIGVTYGRQVARPDASLFARHLRSFNYGDTGHVRSYADRHRLGLKTVFVSNSCAAYRKSILAQVGYFGACHLFGEDSVTVGRILQHGYCIAYVAEAMVYHSHNYSISQEFKRYFDVGAFHRQQHWLIDGYGTVKGEGSRYVRSELRYILQEKKLFLVPSSLIRNLMKLAGYKLGYYYRSLPGRLPPRLSMNRHWWENKEIHEKG